jgi:stearoyl-CoA desaturase (delta-9 desaturase)
MENSQGSRWALWRTQHGTLTLGIVPFILLQASVLLVFTTPFSWTGVAVCALSYLVRMFAITGFYHRYFSHRTYQMGRLMQFIAAFLGATATQKGALWWAAHHRKHHKESDTGDDPHNSREGFWHAHWLWFLYAESNEVEYERIPELARYPELRLLERFWYASPLLLGLGLFAMGGWHWVVWGYFVSTFLLSNATYTINSLMHYWGKQQFYTGDESRNHWLLALLTLGEGWHNNHHRYQAAARNGFFWYELDITYYGLKLLSLLGLVRQLTPVPAKIVEEARLNLRLRQQARTRGETFVLQRVLRSDLQATAMGRPLVAEALRRVRREMQGLSGPLAKRGQVMRTEIEALSRQVAERGRLMEEKIQVLAAGAGEGWKLQVDLQGLGDQVVERGRAWRAEFQRLSDQLAEKGREMRRELERLGGLLANQGKQVQAEVEWLGEQVGQLAQRLRLEVEALGNQVAEKGKALRAQIEGLGGPLPA